MAFETLITILTIESICNYCDVCFDIWFALLHRKIIALVCATLENSNKFPVLVLDVFINGDDEHEDKEDPSPAQKVPDVVSEEKNSFIRVCARKKNLHIFPSQ